MTTMPITESESMVISALLEVAARAAVMMDDGDDTWMRYAAGDDNYCALIDALYELDKCANEAPEGYANGSGTFNARHMLRRLIRPAGTGETP